MDRALKDRRTWAFLALVVAVFAALLVWSQQTGGEEGQGSGSATTPVAGISPSTLPTDATGIPTAVGPAPSASGATDGGDGEDDGSGLPDVPLADLPPEAAETVALIDAGGPFRYDRDGSTFGNYEGLLPEHPHGYYAEYTVETPGSSDRGARRIVAGDRGELYWTEDHYASFSRIER